MAALRYAYPDDAAREAEVAAFVAEAKRRALAGLSEAERARLEMSGEAPSLASPEPPPPAPVADTARCRRCGCRLAKCDCDVRYSRAGKQYRRGES